MTNKELIAELQKHPDNIVVMFTEGKLFPVLGIETCASDGVQFLCIGGGWSEIENLDQISEDGYAN